MVADDTQAVDRLPMLRPSERHRVLYEWNDTEDGVSRDKCVHELFEEQVAKNPMRLRWSSRMSRSAMRS